MKGSLARGERPRKTARSYPPPQPPATRALLPLLLVFSPSNKEKQDGDPVPSGSLIPPIPSALFVLFVPSFIRSFTHSLTRSLTRSLLTQ